MLSQHQKQDYKKNFFKSQIVYIMPLFVILIVRRQITLNVKKLNYKYVNIENANLKYAKIMLKYAQNKIKKKNILNYLIMYLCL